MEFKVVDHVARPQSWGQSLAKDRVVGAYIANA
jgi:hypothetical protein